MQGAGLFIVFLVLVGGIATFAYRANQKRTAELNALAAQLGLRYLPRDPGNVLAAPFRFFKQGSRRKAKDFIVGDHRDHPVQLFDFEYTVQNGDSSTTHVHACIIVTIPAAAPLLGIGHENLLTRLGSHLGLRDVEFESEDFNRLFRVHCDDQRFAFSLIDAAMMEWLVNHGSAIVSIEVAGPWLLFVFRKLRPLERITLIDTSDAFLAKVPDVVYSTYPPR